MELNNTILPTQKVVIKRTPEQQNLYYQNKKMKKRAKPNIHYNLIIDDDSIKPEIMKQINHYQEEVLGPRYDINQASNEAVVLFRARGNLTENIAMVESFFDESKRCVQLVETNKVMLVHSCPPLFKHFIDTLDKLSAGELKIASGFITSLSEHMQLINKRNEEINHYLYEDAANTLKILKRAQNKDLQLNAPRTVVVADSSQAMDDLHHSSFSFSSSSSSSVADPATGIDVYEVTVDPPMPVVPPVVPVTVPAVIAPVVPVTVPAVIAPVVPGFFARMWKK